MNWLLFLLLAGPSLLVALVTLLVFAVLAPAAPRRLPTAESFWPQPQPHCECAIGPATALHHAPTVKSMNTSPLLLAFALGFGLSALNLSAQDPGGDPRPGPPPGGPRGGPPHRPPPLIAALDANHDGRIDATEIANSSAALAALDLNKDGQLSADELQPPPPPGAADGQQAPPPPPGGPGRPGFKLPLMTALDTDGDGVLSAQEIANAPTALKTLDKNGDGDLTPDEFHGMARGGRRGPGFGGGDPSRRHPPPQ